MIIAVNGCFDLLHIGHLRLLKYARSLGNELIVFVNTDESIQKLKGADRPLVPLEQRIEMLHAIRYVDAIYPFSTEEELEKLLKFFKPDILVKDDLCNI